MSEERCPYCGSKNVRESNGREFARNAGKFTGALIMQLAGFGNNKMCSSVVENMGAAVGEFLYNKYVCEDCGRIFSGNNVEDADTVDNRSVNSSYQNGNSGNANFSNPRQRKFYNELIQISRNKGGFTFNDIPSIKDKAKGFGLDKTEVYKVAIACYWKNGRKPLRSEFSNGSSSSGSSTSTQSSFVSFKDYNQGNGGRSARSSSQNCNSENTNFSNPHQKKFYKKLFPLSCERGGFSFGDIQMIKDLGKSFGLNQSEIHKVAIACFWKNGRKPSINDFLNG